MSELFDDISRIVGGPMPRRQVIRLAAGALAGSALAVLWPARSKAQSGGCPELFAVDSTTTHQYDVCTDAEKAQFCTIAKQENTHIAGDVCPSTCGSLMLISMTDCNPVCQGGNMTASITGNYICCPTKRVCKNKTFCCSPTQACCGGTACCAPAACNPNGVCVGGNPG